MCAVAATRTIFAPRLVAPLALAIFAGCGGGAPAPPAPSTPSGAATLALANHHFGIGAILAHRRIGLAGVSPLRGDTSNCPKRHLIYLSDNSNNVVDIYPQRGGPGQNLCGQITGFSGPEGLVTDNTGNLYVANTNASTVEEFAPGAMSPKLTIADTGQYPAGVRVSKQRNIIVTNLITTTYGPGSVSIFNSSGTLLSNLSDKNALEEFFVTTDPKGHIFTTYMNSGSVGAVNEFIGSHVKELPITLTFPGGIEYEDGKLLVMDAGAKTISVYPPPFKKATTTISLTQSAYPIGFDLKGGDRAFYTADGGDISQEYSYPTGTLLNTIQVIGPVEGVALSPDGVK